MHLNLVNNNFPMKKILHNVTTGLSLWALPFLVFAQGTNPNTNFSNVSSFLNNFIDFINGTLVPFIFALAFLVFIWGVAQYFIFSHGSEEGQEKGKNLMLWGLIGFFVMVSVWGIVNLLVGAAGLGGQTIDTNLFPSAPKTN